MSELIKTVKQYDFAPIIDNPNNKSTLALNNTMSGTKKKFYDFWNDEGVNSLGYNSEIIENSINDFVCEGCIVHTPKMYVSDEQEVLAHMLSKTFHFKEMTRVMFHNSGTEANEAAIKLARKYWYDNGLVNKKAIISFRKQFHGRTGFSLAAGDSIESPHHYEGFGRMPEDFILFSDLVDDSTYQEKYLEQYGSDCVAAFILAPVLGNNCVKFYDDEFFERLKNYAEKYNILIIFDEIQVGTGRTGKFWAYENTNINPDILTFGKGIAGGFPLSGIMTSMEISKSFTLGSHFNTTGGNNLSCIVAANVVNYITKHLNEINVLGEYIKDIFERMNCVLSINGLGIHLSLTMDWDKLDCNAYEFCNKCFELGLLVVVHKEFGEIRFFPALNTKKSEIDMGTFIINEVINYFIDKGKS